jgi:hypothetical protein
MRLEGFHGRSYTLVKTAVFQSNHSENAPRILPSVEKNYCQDFCGGTFNWDSVFANLDFPNHRTAQKVISNISWSKKMLLPHGNILNVSGTLSIKGLRITERERTDYNSSFGVVPQIHVSWYWPLVCYSDWNYTIFTPIFGVIIAGNKKVGDVFEDRFCEIDEMNVFEDNRSTSVYNLDSGKRIYYGAKLSGYRDGENLYHFVVGRSVELTTPSERLETSGMRHKHSNIIAALDVLLTDELTFNCNGSYSTVNKKWLKIESGLHFSNEKFEVDLMAFRGKQAEHNPFVVNADSMSENQKTQKYKGIALDANWHISATSVLKMGIVIGNEFKRSDNVDERNIDRYKLAKYYVGICHKNECTEVNFIVERRNYNDGDLKPETSISLVVHLKNLGI